MTDLGLSQYPIRSYSTHYCTPYIIAIINTISINAQTAISSCTITRRRFPFSIFLFSLILHRKITNFNCNNPYFNHF